VSAPPKTVLRVSDQEAQAIRAAVRAADPESLAIGRAIAGPEHVDGLLALLSDPRVSDPVYDLPRPFTRDSVAAWVAQGLAERTAGEGLLMVSLDEEGQVAGYSKVTVWPDRSAAELGGAMRADLQNTGRGGEGMARSFGWIFATLGVRMMCLTAALDNIRVQKGIDRAGFIRMGERDAVRSDGSIRRSIYWEITAEQWASLYGR
jgi:RimJ/RimL family protein N-acetyltransferase